MVNYRRCSQVKSVKIFNIMGNTPFFSVITLSYNSVNSIDRTIQSLKKQSFNDFEVIFQDAGSNDGTIGKIKKNLDQFRKASLVTQS